MPKFQVDDIIEYKLGNKKSYIGIYKVVEIVYQRSWRHLWLKRCHTGYMILTWYEEGAHTYGDGKGKRWPSPPFWGRHMFVTAREMDDEQCDDVDDSHYECSLSI